MRALSQSEAACSLAVDCLRPVSRRERPDALPAFLLALNEAPPQHSDL